MNKMLLPTLGIMAGVYILMFLLVLVWIWFYSWLDRTFGAVNSALVLAGIFTLFFLFRINDKMGASDD
jgi:hypothetical protein